MHSALVVGLVALGAAATEAATCQRGYDQCGGQGWPGATCCVDGFTCVVTNQWYSQCVPGTAAPTTKPATTPTPTTTTPAPTSTTTPTPTSTSTTTPTPTTTATSGPTTPAPSTTPNASGAYLTYANVTVPAHAEAPYPSDTKCPSGMPLSDCMSGAIWGEQTTVTPDEKWHYSRSTHYGITTAGACGFGMYGLCTKGSKTANWTDAWLGTTCDAFCKAYPLLCKDPDDITLRGNFAAPNGDYYSQFWPHLEGDRDNYLSCGECFELVRTKPDGTDYAIGEAGYTDPIVLEITDSCPCAANTKWCCGSGADQCQEIDFKYGCPIPKDSTHLDLSDIAMGRLQGSGTIGAGVIPTRYKRVPCPKVGNIYVWMQQAGPYYFALGIVNTAGVGGIAKVEIKGAGDSKWTTMQHNPDFPQTHPQERYGSWTIPRDTGPFNVPIGLRVTSPNGEQVVNEKVITTFTPPATAPDGFWYLDFGAQFSLDGKH